MYEREPWAESFSLATTITLAARLVCEKPYINFVELPTGTTLKEHSNGNQQCLFSKPVFKLVKKYYAVASHWVYNLSMPLVLVNQSGFAALLKVA